MELGHNLKRFKLERATPLVQKERVREINRKTITKSGVFNQIRHITSARATKNSNSIQFRSSQSVMSNCHIKMNTNLCTTKIQGDSSLLGI